MLMSINTPLKQRYTQVKIAREENHEEVNCHPHALSCSFASSTLSFSFSRCPILLNGTNYSRAMRRKWTLRLF
ncbi:hypothetical protein CRYUN_Cryun02cG0160500 [Craigia yunnanensis]